MPIDDLSSDDDTDSMANRLDRLCQDDDYGETAQMAIGLSALLTLPRNVSDPTPLNVGGVSDITNRGKPQNLLMTELAADPMLLAARIAHGQALYLRRESPPAPTPNLRPLAIESGHSHLGRAAFDAGRHGIGDCPTPKLGRQINKLPS